MHRLIFLIAVVMLAHGVLGLYAIYDEGFFAYGLTAPERILYHLITGGESHITVTGAVKYVLDDLCFQSCSNCPLYCYKLSDLELVCSDSCTIVARKGKVLAKEGDEFTSVLKEGMLYGDVTFRCYDSVCGFDTTLDENHTYSTHLPAELQVASPP